MRLSPNPPLDDAQVDLLERVAGRRDNPPLAFLMWAHNPPLAECIEGLLAHCRTGTAIPLRLRTLAMVMVGRHFDSPSMWNAHYQQAISRGITVDALDRLRRREEPAFAEEDLRVFYTFAREVLDRHTVSQSTYDAALALFGEAALLDIVACIGAFTISAYALNTFHQALRPEEGLPFNDLDPAIAEWYLEMTGEEQ